MGKLFAQQLWSMKLNETNRQTSSDNNINWRIYYDRVTYLEFGIMKMKIKISSDGKIITGLYSDKFPWRKLGKFKVERASDVFFDSSEQKWKIKILYNQEVLPSSFLSRRGAIIFEREYLESDDFTQAKKRFDERIRNLESAGAHRSEASFQKA